MDLGSLEGSGFWVQFYLFTSGFHLQNPPEPLPTPTGSCGRSLEGGNVPPNTGSPPDSAEKTQNFWRSLRNTEVLTHLFGVPLVDGGQGGPGGHVTRLSVTEVRSWSRRPVRSGTPVSNLAARKLRAAPVSVRFYPRELPRGITCPCPGLPVPARLDSFSGSLKLSWIQTEPEQQFLFNALVSRGVSCPIVPGVRLYFGLRGGPARAAGLWFWSA